MVTRRYVLRLIRRHPDAYRPYPKMMMKRVRRRIRQPLPHCTPPPQRWRLLCRSLIYLPSHSRWTRVISRHPLYRKNVYQMYHSSRDLHWPLYHVRIHWNDELPDVSRPIISARCYPVHHRPRSSVHPNDPLEEQSHRPCRRYPSLLEEIHPTTRPRVSDATWTLTGALTIIASHHLEHHPHNHTPPSLQAQIPIRPCV